MGGTEEIWQIDMESHTAQMACFCGDNCHVAKVAALHFHMKWFLSTDPKIKAINKVSHRNLASSEMQSGGGLKPKTVEDFQTKTKGFWEH